jgi:Zn-dependent peptidase ImmA (M78 family)
LGAPRHLTNESKRIEEDMTRPRYRLARSKAADLLKVSAVREPPVPVEHIATLVGATIRYEPFAGRLSGMVKRVGDSAIIGVNSMHPRTRQRFTIAHEIAHLVLHKHQTLHIDEDFPIRFRSDTSSKATDAFEVEANQFAAELLMPLFLISKDIAEVAGKVDVAQAIRQLSRRYEVSEEAMTIRLNALQVVA